MARGWPKGKPCYEETKSKISNALKGRRSPMKGRHQSESVKKKISDALLGHSAPLSGNFKQRKPGRPLSAWLREVPESRRRRAKKLWTRFDLTLSQYDKMVVAQEGRCAICNRQMLDPCVDHDHQTGDVRGLLCRGCNTFAGWYEMHWTNLVVYLNRPIPIKLYDKVDVNA